MAVQQIFRVFCDYYVDGIQHALQIALFYRGSTKIRHHKVAYKHNLLLWQADKHSIVGFPAFDWNELEWRSPNAQLGPMIDRDIGPEGTNIVWVEALPEKGFT